jgi:hypothetical protein
MNLETLSIEQLADLRDQVIATLNDRVSARQKELQGEIDRLGGVVSSFPGQLNWAGHSHVVCEGSQVPL